MSRMRDSRSAGRGSAGARAASRRAMRSAPSQSSSPSRRAARRSSLPVGSSRSADRRSSRSASEPSAASSSWKRERAVWASSPRPAAARAWPSCCQPSLSCGVRRVVASRKGTASADRPALARSLPYSSRIPGAAGAGASSPAWTAARTAGATGSRVARAASGSPPWYWARASCTVMAGSPAVRPSSSSTAWLALPTVVWASASRRRTSRSMAPEAPSRRGSRRAMAPHGSPRICRTAAQRSCTCGSSWGRRARWASASSGRASWTAQRAPISVARRSSGCAAIHGFKRA